MAIRDSEIFPVSTTGTVTVQNFFMEAIRASYWLPLKASRQGTVIQLNKATVGTIGF